MSSCSPSVFLSHRSFVGSANSPFSKYDGSDVIVGDGEHSKGFVASGGGGPSYPPWLGRVIAMSAHTNALSSPTSISAMDTQSTTAPSTVPSTTARETGKQPMMGAFFDTTAGGAPTQVASTMDLLAAVAARSATANMDDTSSSHDTYSNTNTSTNTDTHAHPATTSGGGATDTTTTTTTAARRAPDGARGAGKKGRTKDRASQKKRKKEQVDGYPCGQCQEQVSDEHEAILCEQKCMRWFHRPCAQLTPLAYHALMNTEDAMWACSKCLPEK